MANNIRLEHLSLSGEIDYDVVVATLGYERRARAVSERFPSGAAFRKYACGFPGDHVLNYAANKDWFFGQEYVIAEPSDADYGQWFQNLVKDSLEGQDDLVKIRVDISSMTRTRLAHTIEVLNSATLKKPVLVDFAYSLAQYSAPPQFKAKNTHVGPVTPAYSGWWTEPDKPLTAIIGLGYEENKALGALEHIQAADAWIFVPQSSIAAYSQTLQRANKDLLEMVNGAQVLNYPVEDPFLTLSRMESLCAALLSQKNIAILPFGPKIFALVALLIARLHFPQIAVWRVSGSEEIVDRLPSEEFIGLRAIFQP